jgi:hypothetical protein
MTHKSNRQPRTLREAILFFADHENCRKGVEAIRRPDGVVPAVLNTST